MLTNNLFKLIALAAIGISAQYNTCLSSKDTKCIDRSGNEHAFGDEYSCWSIIGDLNRCEKPFNGQCPFAYNDTTKCFNGSHTESNNEEAKQPAPSSQGLEELTPVDESVISKEPNPIKPPQQGDDDQKSKGNSGSCPNSNATCKSSDGSPKNIKDSDYSCWANVSDGWLCQKAVNGVCPFGYNNISKCGSSTKPNPISYPGPIPPKCPPPNRGSTMCINSQGKRYTFARPERFVCWSMINNQYQCTPYGPSGRCNSSQIDVSNCHITPSECPPYADTTTECIGPNGPAGTFADPGEYTCWLKIGNSFACNTPTKDGICGPGEVDVTTCPIRQGYSD